MLIRDKHDADMNWGQLDQAQMGYKHHKLGAWNTNHCGKVIDYYVLVIRSAQGVFARFNAIKEHHEVTNASFCEEVSFP